MAVILHQYHKSVSCYPSPTCRVQVVARNDTWSWFWPDYLSCHSHKLGKLLTSALSPVANFHSTTTVPAFQSDQDGQWWRTHPESQLGALSLPVAPPISTWHTVDTWLPEFQPSLRNSQLVLLSQSGVLVWGKAWTLPWGCPTKLLLLGIVPRWNCTLQRFTLHFSLHV